MTNDNINQNAAQSQADHQKLFDCIANISVALIISKAEIERAQAKLQELEETIGKALNTGGDIQEIKLEEKDLIYNFTQDELYAMDSLHDSTCELLTLMQGVTGRIVSHISVDEAKEILTLQMDITRIYNNYKYHLPSIKQFENWLKEQLQNNDNR